MQSKAKHSTFLFNYLKASLGVGSESDTHRSHLFKRLTRKRRPVPLGSSHCIEITSMTCNIVHNRITILFIKYHKLVIELQKAQCLTKTKLCYVMSDYAPIKTNYPTDYHQIRQTLNPINTFYFCVRLQSSIK